MNIFLRETDLKMYIIIFLDEYPYNEMDIRHSLKINRKIVVLAKIPEFQLQTSE